MNIVLVVFDTLRRDCINYYGAPPWGKVHTPNFDSFAKQSLTMLNAFPEALPTLQARRSLYTGQRTYPYRNGDIKLKGDFYGSPGWGPIPEDQSTLAEIFQDAGYRTGLVADLYHMFKPSKNFWRGFNQWTFLRGQERDPYNSGPKVTQTEIDYWLPRELQNEETIPFINQVILNVRERKTEFDFFSPKVLFHAANWLEENQDAEKFFLTVESFDPHEPWVVPTHYRRLYDKEDGQEQVISTYTETTHMDEKILARTRANYSGSVTQCDRWFGYLMETMRVLGKLENTMVIVASDHGHNLGDANILGKFGYPSHPATFRIPLMVRFPNSKYAGKTSNMFVQFNDISATILEAAGVEPPAPMDGRSFIKDAISGNRGPRDHVTIGWGSTPTVVTDRWWMNCKVDGTGFLLYDLHADDPFIKNVADDFPQVVFELFDLAKEDAKGDFPEYLVELAKNEADAPGCSDLAARH